MTRCCALVLSVILIASCGRRRDADMAAVPDDSLVSATRTTVTAHGVDEFARVRRHGPVGF